MSSARSTSSAIGPARPRPSTCRAPLATAKALSCWCKRARRTGRAPFLPPRKPKDFEAHGRERRPLSPLIFFLRAGKFPAVGHFDAFRLPRSRHIEEARPHALFAQGG